MPSSMAPVAIETAKEPQCWDHGCNGRQFNTFGDLLRQQRESSNTPRKHTCHRCDAEFTRKTARDDHLAHDNCKRQLSSESLVAPQGDANVRRTRPEPRYSMTPEMQNCYASSLPQQPQFNLLPPYTYCPPAPPAVPCGNPQQAYGPVPGTQPDAAMSIQPNLEGAFQQPQQEAFEALRPSRVRAFRKKPRLAPKPKPKDDLPIAANQQANPPATVLHRAQTTASGYITRPLILHGPSMKSLGHVVAMSEMDDNDEESDLDLIGHEGGDEDVDAVVTELLKRYTTLFV